MSFLWTGFLIGMVGSLHCAGMCGPIALLLPIPGKSPISRLMGRLTYNSGRLLTYIVLGMLSGLAGHVFFMAGLQRWLSMGLGILLILGLLFSFGNKTGPFVIRFIVGLRNVLGALLKKRSYPGLGLIGVLNGFLPCGLVWAACAGAAATLDVFRGGLYMLCFGMGTVPMMLAMSFTGTRFQRQFISRLKPLVTCSLALMGVLLILRGMSLGIPFISPESAIDSGMPSCH